MSETAVIGAIRAWLEDCPLLSGASVLVDFLPERKPDAQKVFSVDTQPGTSIAKAYTDGTSIRQHFFCLRSLEWFDGDTLQSIANCGFYEQFSNWVQAQSRDGILPQLPAGKIAQCAEVKGPGYLYATDSTVGRYLIQCRLQYLQE